MAIVHCTTVLYDGKITPMYMSENLRITYSIWEKTGNDNDQRNVHLYIYKNE
jgi:hypothetical protein